MPRPFKQYRRLRLHFIAVHFGKFPLKFRGADAVLLGKFRLGVNRLPFGHHLVETFVSHYDRVEDGLLIESELILAENRNSLPRTDDNLALVRFSFTGEDLQKSGLAGAVRADQAVAVTGSELDVDVFKDNPLAVGEGDICC